MHLSVDQSIQLVCIACIGRSGTNFWHPRRPELTPIDYFLWGYVKNILYGDKMRDPWHLRDRITVAIATVTPDMIQRTWHEIE
jgi:hypothetical protein